MNNKRGIAIVVVLFFAFAIAIILFFMAQSNTNLAFQNKQTLYQMQAYYLAHSGLQHAKLQLKLLPKETYEYFYKGGTGNPFEYVDSSAYPPLAMGAEYKDTHKSYDLFEGNAPDEGFPYAGNYRITSCKLLGSHDSMKMIQDGYKLEVESEVDSGGKGKTFSDSLTEEVYVARFTGAVD